MTVRRRFTKKERIALFLAADGCSEISGEPLEDGWHADHIVPFSKGGATDVSNGQAITPEENRAKSDQCFEPRQWQDEFFLLCQKGAADISCAALPAAGKTFAALAPVRAWLSIPSTKKQIVIVVAPTLLVRKQWRDAAHKPFGLNLETASFVGNIKSGFDGIAITYATVASQPLLFRRLCAMHEAFIIFDEVHHAGDRQSWGEAILEAFELAERRICLSGTPFRHDDQRIPFLRVGADGFYEMDFIYDYPRALKDGVIRDLAFHHYGGSVELALGDEIYKFHTDDDLEPDDVSRRLVGLLRSKTFTQGLLRQAHAKLLHVRRAKPDAAALALAIDANHAVALAKLLEEITGEAPDVLVSDNTLATIPDVERFRDDASKKWIVAVRMVSEGVDIARLMILAYLTNTATELFFRQAIGRIVRNQGTDSDTEAYCFLPDDPRLRAYAAKIEEFQKQVISEAEEDEQRKRRNNDEIERRRMEILNSSDAKLARLTLGGKGHETNAAHIRDLAAIHGTTENEMAAIIADVMGIKPEQPTTRKHDDVTKEERMVQLRKTCSRLTNRIANKEGVEPKDIHIAYLKIANVAQGAMTEAQLEAKRAWLLKRLSA